MLRIRRRQSWCSQIKQSKCRTVPSLEVFYMHTRGVCHRDLKPENFLFLSKGTWAWHLRSLESAFEVGFLAGFEVKLPVWSSFLAFRIQALAFVSAACSCASVLLKQPSDSTGPRALLPRMGHCTCREESWSLESYNWNKVRGYIIRL